MEKLSRNRATVLIFANTFKLLTASWRIPDIGLAWTEEGLPAGGIVFITGATFRVFSFSFSSFVTDLYHRNRNNEIPVKMSARQTTRNRNNYDRVRDEGDGVSTIDNIHCTRADCRRFTWLCTIIQLQFVFVFIQWMGDCVKKTLIIRLGVLAWQVTERWGHDYWRRVSRLMTLPLMPDRRPSRDADESDNKGFRWVDGMWWWND